MFANLMKRAKPAFAAIAVLMLPAAFIAPQAATAQGTKVLVYDQQRVMRESRAGQDIVGKLKAMGDSTANQLKPEGEGLENERKSLEARTANLTPQQISADAGLKAQVESFGRRFQTYTQKVQKNGQELALTERDAWRQFFQALEPVLNEVATQRGAQIMLERSSVVYVSPTVDVTAEIIAKMDGRLSSVAVVRKSIPTQPQ